MKTIDFDHLRSIYESGEQLRVTHEAEQAWDEHQAAGESPDTSMVSCVVAGNPIPKGRPIVTDHGAYTPERTSAWETAVGWAYKGRPLLVGPLSIHLHFYRQTRIRVDLDNLVKAVCDGLNGVAYKDDSQITHIEADLFYDRDNPRAEIEIGPKGDSNDSRA